MNAPASRRRRLLLAALLALAAPLHAQPLPTPPRLWFDAAGHALPQAAQAIALLADAASHGLDPQDYRAERLRQAFGRVETPAATDAAERELTSEFERYLSDLHSGRVDPAALGARYPRGRANGFDPGQALRSAWQRKDLASAVAAAVPQLPQYALLREALAHYRALGEHPAWSERLPPLPQGARARKLEPGQPWSGLARLAQRLELLGDIDPARPLAPVSRYEGELVDAVSRFQLRHGLAPDGVIGAATLGALEVSPEARADQIALALERMRWTPLLQASRMVVVNLPEFMLRAYEVVDGRIRLRLESRVVVGKALDTRTPLIDAQMRQIEFSPYWNVPPSIARQETIPRLRRDPGYFHRMGFEFVTAAGQVVTGLSGSQLGAVLAGSARIRQRPGPQNALGDIKFVFPNPDHIYLHHTPAVSLFGRQRRDYSHGCIRVEKPVELAEFVLEGMGWDRDRIEAAMQRGSSNTLAIAQPLPVLIAYGTTLVKGGRIHFFDDIYGHDRLLAAALRQRRRPD